MTAGTPDGKLNDPETMGLGGTSESISHHCWKNSFSFSDGRRSGIFLHARLMVGPSGYGSFWADVLFLIIKLLRVGC